MITFYFKTAGAVKTIHHMNIYVYSSLFYYNKLKHYYIDYDVEKGIIFDKSDTHP
jgi:hypothetical protein